MRKSDFLKILDRERRIAGLREESGLVREWSPDKSECRIVFAEVPANRIEDIARLECARASTGGYRLEWKVYAHDPLPELAQRLRLAGFKAGESETVLGLELKSVLWPRFDELDYEIRTLHDASAATDVATISTQIGRNRVDSEKRRLGEILREQNTRDISIHVAYVDGEPVSCGRIHYGRMPEVAELAGGRTVTTHRRRGLFTAIIVARLREAAARECRYVFVDALPTSEPILARIGFVALTTTQPFVCSC